LVKTVNWYNGKSIKEAGMFPVFLFKKLPEKITDHTPEGHDENKHNKNQ
jgi:hypothetical protein